MKAYVPLALVALCVPAYAADGPWSVTLRAAEEMTPDQRQWDQGAAISHQSVNGDSSTQIDAVLKLSYGGLVAFPAARGSPPYMGDTLRWSIGAGPYLHKLNGTDKPQDDRGALITLSGHYVPGGDPSAPRHISYDAALTLTFGETLKAGTGAASTVYSNVDSNRQIVSGGLYWQPLIPGRYFKLFVRPSVKLYSDEVSGSPQPESNGRVSGVMGLVQATIAPLGWDPTAFGFGGLGFAPLIVLSAQVQRDFAASGGRTEGTHRLYSAALSLPLTARTSGYGGPEPSIDIERSTGEDILKGREKKGITSVVLRVKY